MMHHPRQHGYLFRFASKVLKYVRQPPRLSALTGWQYPKLPDQRNITAGSVWVGNCLSAVGRFGSISTG
jgi:hypothetical protein